MRRTRKGRLKPEVPHNTAYHCNHPLALVIDPTDRELRELEQMLANCPDCSRWAPGDGPIMAVVSRHGNVPDEGPKELA